MQYTFFQSLKCGIPFPKPQDRVKGILEILCQGSISAFLPLMFWDQLTALPEPQLHIARRDGGMEAELSYTVTQHCFQEVHLKTLHALHQDIQKLLIPPP